MTSRRAFTLVELLVSLAIMGLLAAIVAPAWRPGARAGSTIAGRVGRARSHAVASGRDTVLLVTGDSDVTAVRIRADGSVIAPPSLGLDRWTGRRSGDTTFREPRP